MARPLRALLQLASVAVALISVSSASPDLENQITSDPFKDVDADLVSVLTPDEIRTQILGTPDLWSLFVFNSDMCEASCEQQSAAFIEAAKLGGSVGRFGVLDVKAASKDEAAAAQMATSELGVNSIPTLRVFNKPPVLNKYTSKLWRPSVVFNGQFTARSVRKGIEKAMPKDTLKQISSMAEHDAIVAQARASNLALVLLMSTKERIAALTSSLSMSVHNRAIVAQVQPGATTADVLAKYAVEKAPALVVLPVTKSEEESTFEIFSDSLSGKTVRDLAAFVLARSPEAVDTTGSQGGDIKDGAPKKASISLRAQAKQLIHKAKETSLPAVVAYRVGTEQKTTPDEKWDAFEERLVSYGMAVGTVLCSDLQAESASEEGEEKEMPEECTKLLKDWGPGFHMAVYSFVQRTPTNLKDDLVDTPKEVTRVHSLSDAKATAVDSIPERVAILTADDTMSRWMAAVIQMKQGIPTILVGKQSDPPIMFKAFAAGLSGIASFAYVQDKTGDALAGLGAPEGTTIPALLAFMPGKGEDGKQEQQMMLAMYDRYRLGKFTYMSMASFVLGMGNEGYQEDTALWMRRFGAHAGMLPFNYKFSDGTEKEQQRSSGNAGPSPSSSSDLKVFTEEALTPETWESSCASHASNIICIVGFLDGDVANTDLGTQVQTLKDAAETSAKRPSQAAQFVFMWVDATCYKSFAQELNVDVAILPSVVAYHPGKKLTRKHVMGYTDASVLSFLEGIKSNQGRGFSPVSVSPSLDKTIDCATVDGRDVRGSGDEDDDDDMAEMLKEIQEEEKRQKNLEKQEAKLRVKNAKKEEADRVAKAKVEAEKARAGKQTKQRRRRRRRKGRKGGAKDEL